MSTAPLFFGTKLVAGQPMTRQQWCDYRGWKLPANEDGADQGYLVEYKDGGKPNDPRHKGYISWSPKEVFEGSYREISGLTFGHAIEALKMGKKVQRAGWNGKGQHVSYVSGDQPRGFLPYMQLFNAQGTYVPWLPSQSDCLADDWRIVQ
jgi:hypothetical protein